MRSLIPIIYLAHSPTHCMEVLKKLCCTQKSNITKKSIPKFMMEINLSPLFSCLSNNFHTVFQSVTNRLQEVLQASACHTVHLLSGVVSDWLGWRERFSATFNQHQLVFFSDLNFWKTISMEISQQIYIHSHH